MKKTHVFDEGLDGDVGGGVDELDTWGLSEGGAQVLDTLDDGGLVLVSLEVGDIGHGHGETRGDSKTTARGSTTSKVLRDGHGTVVTQTGRALNTSGPLELTLDAVGTLDFLPEDRADVGSRLGKRASTAVEVEVLVSGDRSVESAVPVVEDGGRNADDSVSVGMVVQVLADRELDPFGLGNHLALIRAGGSDDLELVGRTDTGAHENLGGTEDTSRQNDTSTRLEVDVTAVTALAESLDIKTSDSAAAAGDTSDSGVHPESKVVAGVGLDKVSSHGTVALTVGVHVRSV